MKSLLLLLVGLCLGGCTFEANAHIDGRVCVGEDGCPEDAIEVAQEADGGSDAQTAVKVEETADAGALPDANSTDAKFD